jgi:hypothetical protein
METINPSISRCLVMFVLWQINKFWSRAPADTVHRVQSAGLADSQTYRLGIEAAALLQHPAAKHRRRLRLCLQISG